MYSFVALTYLTYYYESAIQNQKLRKKSIEQINLSQIAKKKINDIKFSEF